MVHQKKHFQQKTSNDIFFSKLIFDRHQHTVLLWYKFLVRGLIKHRWDSMGCHLMKDVAPWKTLHWTWNPLTCNQSTQITSSWHQRFDHLFQSVVQSLVQVLAWLGIFWLFRESNIPGKTKNKKTNPADSIWQICRVSSQGIHTFGVASRCTCNWQSVFTKWYWNFFLATLDPYQLGKHQWHAPLPKRTFTSWRPINWYILATEK